MFNLWFGWKDVYGGGRIYPYPHLNCYKLCAMEIGGKSKADCMEGVFVILMYCITLAYSGPAARCSINGDEIRSSFLGS